MLNQALRRRAARAAALPHPARRPSRAVPIRTDLLHLRLLPILRSAPLRRRLPRPTANSRLPGTGGTAGTAMPVWIRESGGSAPIPVAADRDISERMRRGARRRTRAVAQGEPAPTAAEQHGSPAGFTKRLIRAYRCPHHRQRDTSRVALRSPTGPVADGRGPHATLELGACDWMDHACVIAHPQPQSLKAPNAPLLSTDRSRQHHRCCDRHLATSAASCLPVPPMTGRGRQKCRPRGREGTWASSLHPAR